MTLAADYELDKFLEAWDRKGTNLWLRDGAPVNSVTVERKGVTVQIDKHPTRAGEFRMHVLTTPLVSIAFAASELIEGVNATTNDARKKNSDHLQGADVRIVLGKIAKLREVTVSGKPEKLAKETPGTTISRAERFADLKREIPERTIETAAAMLKRKEITKIFSADTIRLQTSEPAADLLLSKTTDGYALDLVASDETTDLRQRVATAIASHGDLTDAAPAKAEAKLKAAITEIHTLYPPRVKTDTILERFDKAMAAKAANAQPSGILPYLPAYPADDVIAMLAKQKKLPWGTDSRVLGEAMRVEMPEHSTDLILSATDTVDGRGYRLIGAASSHEGKPELVEKTNKTLAHFADAYLSAIEGDGTYTPEKAQHIIRTVAEYKCNKAVARAAEAKTIATAGR